MLDVVIARFLPLFERDRFAVVLAIKIRHDLADPGGLPCVKPLISDLRYISPQHQNISPFGAEETTEAKQALSLHERSMVFGCHVGIEQPNPHSIALVRWGTPDEASQIANHSFICIEAKSPFEI